jgi:hypothetical protein
MEGEGVDLQFLQKNTGRFMPSIIELEYRVYEPKMSKSMSNIIIQQAKETAAHVSDVHQNI